MSTRTVLRPSILPALSLANTGSSSPTILQGLSFVNYAITWTGTTPVGTLALETSSDYQIAPNGTIINAGTWNVAPLGVNGVYSTSIAISGNTGIGSIDVIQIGTYAVRLLYTAASGTGTMTIIVSGKVA
jgi:hypothetical protein